MPAKLSAPASSGLALSASVATTAAYKSRVGGFTLIELLVVMGILALLFSLGTASLSNLIPSTSVSTVTQGLVAELQSQQLKAMLGDTGGDNVPNEHGIYFTNSGYVLFKGGVYQDNDPHNLVVDYGDELTFSTSFPSATVVFSKGSGEVVGMAVAQRTINIYSSVTNHAGAITLNPYGVVIGIE
jgi:prepilin-type N-terminal cleavage/methylation domain-containing protein